MATTPDQLCSTSGAPCVNAETAVADPMATPITRPMAKRIPPVSSMGLMLSITKEINGLTLHVARRRRH